MEYSTANLQNNVGKLLGALCGFSIFLSPLGILVGFLLGAFADFWVVKLHRPAQQKASWQQSFSVATIRLMARMAKADGVVSTEDLQVFRSYFFIPHKDETACAQLFNQARHQTGEVAELLEELKYLCADQPDLFTHLYQALCALAVTDNLPPHPLQMNLLERAATVWKLPAETRRQIEKGFGLGGGRRGAAGGSGGGSTGGSSDAGAGRSVASKSQLEQALELLGLPNGSKTEEIKKSYKKHVKANHPDLLVAQGATPEQVRQAEDRLVQLNAAYKLLQDKN